ncbi:transcription factor HES-5-like [Polypterus senegalus]|uniref:transcription factor HES-5-like n=1 Tax=Polypterus senegalus TaxID=55291 RepID=UPI001964550B|nr:transcription factor HES-5-like [Polypterus senegalus]
MAPVNVLNSYTLSAKDKIKLRKPVVEKMRRDRINNSIEQLKRLLEPQFKRQQATSKLEKADILEMAVCYLRESSLEASPRPEHLQQGYSEGFAKCLQETLRFLSFHDPMKSSQVKLLTHFQKAEPNNLPVPSIHKSDVRENGGSIWRPW